MIKSGYFVGESKSELTLQCLETVLECMDDQIPVVYISTEIDAKTAAWRLVKIMTGIDVLQIKSTRDLSKDEEKSTLAAIRKIKLSDFYFTYMDEKFSADRLKKFCIKAIKEMKVKHIIIDNIPSVEFFITKTRIINDVMVPYNVGCTMAKQGIKGSGLTFHEI